MQSVVEELALSFIAPEKRGDITSAVYARASIYTPGGSTFEKGLFDWEVAAITEPPFPSRGRLLLGGGGGGREMAALVARGYEVVAFEPSPALSDSAARIARALPGAVALEASYADLVRAVRGGSGPLAAVIRSQPFDAIILGWGSFSHVVTDAERQELLGAVRELAPGAPILLSYLAGSAVQVSGGRRLLRDLLRRLGAPGRPAPGDRFQPWSGFHRVTTEAEIERLALDTGYRVAWQKALPYGHAVLVPAEA